MVKYVVSQDEGEIIPNLLNLVDRESIDKAEFEGFLLAELILSEELTSRTKFNLRYIKRIHKLALGHLYSFAGKYRTVNMSKAGFLFPTARFIAKNMESFEKDVLFSLPNNYDDKQDLIRDIAKVHAELLFIHPFREGNGRTARVLANLMARKQGYAGLNFEKIDDKVFVKYVKAVQSAADKNYLPMEEIINRLF